jgi:hypothetical protein
LAGGSDDAAFDRSGVVALVRRRVALVGNAARGAIADDADGQQVADCPASMSPSDARNASAGPALCCGLPSRLRGIGGLQII